MGHSRPLFPPFFRLSIQLTANKCSINFANDWIRTADLQYRKWLLYQLSHNHCRRKKLYNRYYATAVICNIAMERNSKRSLIQAWWLFRIFLIRKHLFTKQEQRKWQTMIESKKERKEKQERKKEKERRRKKKKEEESKRKKKEKEEKRRRNWWIEARWKMVNRLKEAG